MKKVAIIMRGKTISGGGGAERRFSRAINKMLQEKSDYAPYILCNQKVIDEMLENKFIDDSASKYLIPLEKFYSLNKFFSPRLLLKYLKNENIHIIHFPLIQKSLIPLYLNLYLHKNIKVIATIASAPISAKVKQDILTNITLNLICFRANIIDCLYDYFPKNYRRYSSKSRVTPCSFTNYKEFFPSEKEKIICFVGRLVEEKQPILIIEAFKKILDSNCGAEWKLYIIGDGPLKEMVMEKINKLNIENGVKCFSKPNVSSLINSSAIFVSIQKNENYPSQSLLEAMASSNSIVATEVGNTRKILDDGCALFIKSNSVDELAEKLLILIENNKVREELGKNAREKAIYTQSIEKFITYLSELWSI